MRGEADFSFTSAGEFRTNTPYLLIETLKVGREGVLMHPLLAPSVRRPSTSLGQAPGPGSGGAVLGVVLQESGKPHTGKWPHSLCPSPQAPGTFAQAWWGLPGQQMLPAWQAGAEEGYGRNFSSEAGLVRNRAWGGRATAGVITKVKGLGAWCSGFPDEH